MAAGAKGCSNQILPSQEHRNESDAPSFPMFFIAFLFGGAGIAAKLGYLAAATPFAFGLVAIGFVLLLLGTLFRGL